MISLRPDERAFSTLLNRNPSTNGPFQTDLAILLALARAADNQLIRPLVLTCLGALGRLAPGGNRMTATAGAAFATAMRVIDRVHDHTAVMRPAAQPAITASLADMLVHVVGVRN